MTGNNFKIDRFLSISAFHKRGLVTCLLVIAAFFYSNSAKAQTNPIPLNIATLEQNDTKGTFFFTFPTDKTLIMTEDNIVALYAQIESHRLPTSTFHWEYTEEITIVIFAQTIINNPNFTPLNSPYDKIKIAD